jgi:ectoine hydroxylase-related dioxygenase (phytanoyl-CoA dioxygenase family)
MKRRERVIMIEGDRVTTSKQVTVTISCAPPGHVLLEDATRENGCLTVIPGSHKLGLLDHEQTDVPGNTWKLTQEALSRLGDEIPVELSKGSVGFHHCLTYHRSEPNRSPRSRRAYTVIFMTGESRWVGEEDYRYPFLHVQGREMLY